MPTTYAPRLAHMGIACIDIERMIDFYTSVFNLQLTDRGVGFTFPFPLAFMSARSDQHHQVALAQNRPAGSPSTIMQISFKVDTLAELREARLGVVVAIVGGLGSIISEVGAVMMVGGNIDGSTRVLTTAIMLETRRGNLDLAIGLGIVLLMLSFLINFGVTQLQGKGK